MNFDGKVLESFTFLIKYTLILSVFYYHFKNKNRNGDDTMYLDEYKKWLDSTMLSEDEKEELRSVYKAKELKPKTIIFMQNIVLKGTENAKKFVRGNLKMLSVEENKNLLEKATKMVLEKKILDIIYIKSIQENRIKDKYLTGVIYNNIEEEIITRMYYNYLFEKIKKLKVRNEYITIKANDSILKYIKGKEDHNLNKIKELYYIREIKILKENKGVNKNINKLEIIIENNERD